MMTKTTAPNSRIVRADQPALAIIGPNALFEPSEVLHLHGDLTFSARVRQPRIKYQPLGAELALQVARESLSRAHRIDSASAWLQAGLASLAAADTDGAESALRKALSLAEGSREILLALARVEHERGEVDNALLILTRLAAAHPDDLDITVSQAVVLVSGNRVTQARELLDRIDPAEAQSSASLLATRGAICLVLGDNSAAVSNLRKAVRSRPDWVHARMLLGTAELRSGHPSAAERHLRAAVRVGPMYTEALLTLLRLLREQERWTDLLEETERHWKPGCEIAAVALLAAEACYEKGEHRSVRSWLEPIVETADSSQRPVVLNNLGVALGRMEQHEKAAEYFRRAVALDASDNSVANLCYALLGIKKNSESVLIASRFIGLNLFRPVRVREALALGLARLRRIGEAVDVLEAVIRESDATESAFGLLSALYADDLQDAKASIRVVSIGVERYRDSYWLRNNLAYALLLNGETEKASSVIGQMNPDTEEYKKHVVVITATRGLLALCEDSLLEGRDLYERALRLAQSDGMRERVKAKRDLELARALRRVGQLQEARKLLERCASYGESSHPYPDQAMKELKQLSSGD